MEGISIKNIPLNYLLNQSDSYFESNEFKNMTDLFNQIKESTTNDKVDEEKVELLPLTFMKSMLMDMYYDEFEIPIKHEELSKYLVCVLAGKDTNTYTTKARRYINKCTSEVNNRSFILLQENLDKTLYGSDKGTNELDVNDLKSKLPPSKTGNNVLDVIKKMKFYKSNIHSNLYDDDKYAKYVLSSLQNNLNNASIRSSFKNKKLTDNTKKSNISITEVNILRDVLVEKYRKSRINKIVTHEESILSIDRDMKEVISERINTSNRRFGSRVCLVYHHQVIPSKRWELIHNMNTKYCKVEIFVNKTSFKVNVDEVNNNSLIVNFEEDAAGIAIIIFDMFDKEMIVKRDLMFYKDYIEEPFEILSPYESSDNNYFFNITNMNKMYGYFEIFDKFDVNLTDKITSCEFKDDGIYITTSDELAVIDKMILLPTQNFFVGSTLLKLNVSNIESFMSNVNIFNDDYVLVGNNGQY